MGQLKNLNYDYSNVSLDEGYLIWRENEGRRGGPLLHEIVASERGIDCCGQPCDRQPAHPKPRELRGVFRAPKKTENPNERAGRGR